MGSRNVTKREVEGRRRRVGSFQVFTYQADFVAFGLVRYLSQFALFPLNNGHPFKEIVASYFLENRPGILMEKKRAGTYLEGGG